MTHVKIDCERALSLLAAYLDGELEAMDNAALERHVDACRSCYSRAEFERRLKERLGELRREPVSGGLEERIRLLVGELRGGPGTPAK